MVNVGKMLSQFFFGSIYLEAITVICVLVYTLFLVLDTGCLWTWGDNRSGQLGVENLSLSCNPITLSTLAELR